jgi:hypothetical protein
MNQRHLLTLSALAATIAFAGDIPAQQPPPSSAPAASAAAGAGDEGKSLADDPPGSDASKTPKPEEWKTAPKVKLTRDTPGCTAYRIREWLKVHCTGLPAAGASLLAGTRDGVQVWVEPGLLTEGKDAMKKVHDAEVVFPVRRGDGRVFQIAQFGEGYDGPIGWNTGVLVSESWVDGEAAPIISVR